MYSGWPESVTGLDEPIGEWTAGPRDFSASTYLASWEAGADHRVRRYNVEMKWLSIDVPSRTISAD